jgi:hypothetical protein
MPIKNQYGTFAIEAVYFLEGDKKGLGRIPLFLVSKRYNLVFH